MPTPHDALAKFIFSNPQHAAAILRTALPPAVTERIDWSTLELLPTELIGEGLTAQQVDLLFRVSMAGREARLILLLEHQSKVHRRMLLRFLGYSLRMWEEQLREHPNRLLPVVIPVVLHHSKKGWTGAVELVELFDLAPEDRATLAPYLPNFRFVLDDLTQQADEALHARIANRTALMTLLLLKNLRHAVDPAALLKSYLPHLAEVLRAPSGMSALAAHLSYTLRVADIDSHALRSIIARWAPTPRKPS